MTLYLVAKPVEYCKVFSFFGQKQVPWTQQTYGDCALNWKSPLEVRRYERESTGLAMPPRGSLVASLSYPDTTAHSRGHVGGDR